MGGFSAVTLQRKIGGNPSASSKSTHNLSTEEAMLVVKFPDGAVGNSNLEFLKGSFKGSRWRQPEQLECNGAREISTLPHDETKYCIDFDNERTFNSLKFWTKATWGSFICISWFEYIRIPMLLLVDGNHPWLQFALFEGVFDGRH